jgi:hypothetical protein
MHGEKGQSSAPFGIHFSPSQRISVYDGQEVFILAFDSPEEYALYQEYGPFSGKVLEMLDDYFAGLEPE